MDLDMSVTGTENDSSSDNVSNSVSTYAVTISEGSTSDSSACQAFLADIAMIGLGVMGQNLVLNMNNHGYKVCVYNRTTSKVDQFMNRKEVNKACVIGTYSPEELIKKTKRPRRIMLMVKAGPAVDRIIQELVPCLDPGDIIIDGGNSNFTDTAHRCELLERKNLLFVGMGVSEGEIGARKGPSFMPGGSVGAWRCIKDILQDIAAVVNGQPCCEWVGQGGAGHFVKMVHNGHEYGDMQMICEVYHIMKAVLRLNNDQISDIFGDWNKGELQSYLIEITKDIMKFRDKDNTHLIDKILDTAGQRGNGKWTPISALQAGLPVTLIGEAVFSRCLYALKSERISASMLLTGPSPPQENKSEYIQHLQQALYASKIISYAQSFMLLQEAAKQFKWILNYGSIALMWRGGCVIRSTFLGKVKEAFDKQPNLTNLLFNDFFRCAIIKAQPSLRKVVTLAVTHGIPCPCLSAALAFYDGYRTERLPANLIQAQRDYYGSHCYELLNEPGKFHHNSNWKQMNVRVPDFIYSSIMRKVEKLPIGQKGMSAAPVATPVGQKGQSPAPPGQKGKPTSAHCHELLNEPGKFHHNSNWKQMNVPVPDFIYGPIMKKDEKPTVEQRGLSPATDASPPGQKGKPTSVLKKNTSNSKKFQ